MFSIADGEWISWSPTTWGMIAIAFLITMLWRVNKKQLLSMPPSPPAHLIFGHATTIFQPVTTLHERLADVARKYGPAITLHVGPSWLPGWKWIFPDMVMLSDPCLIRDIFVNHNDAIQHEAEISENVGTIIGSCLLSIPEEKWPVHRRYIVSNFFSTEAITALATTLCDRSQVMINTLSARKNPSLPLDLYTDHVIPFTLDVIVDIICGNKRDPMASIESAVWNEDVNALAPDLSVVFQEFNSRTFTPLRAILPTSREHRVSLKRIQDHMASLIRRRRENLAQKKAVSSHDETEASHRRRPHDLLSILAAGEDRHARLIGEGNKPNPYETDAEVQGEAIFFLFAGFETTSSSMAGALYLLARHTEIQARAREEIRSWLEAGGKTKDALRGLPYLTAVLEESMRICPVAHMLTRRIGRDVILGSGDSSNQKYFLPKNTRLIINNLGMSNIDRVWPDAASFRPERWLDTNKMPDPYASLPFGVSIRACPGQRFARFEMKIALVSLLSNFQLDIDPSRPDFERHVAFVLRPKNFSLVVTPLDHPLPSLTV